MPYYEYDFFTNPFGFFNLIDGWIIFLVVLPILLAAIGYIVKFFFFVNIFKWFFGSLFGLNLQQGYRPKRESQSSTQKATDYVKLVTAIIAAITAFFVFINAISR